MGLILIPVVRDWLDMTLLLGTRVEMYLLIYVLQGI